jgi:predicted N-acyltransferase
LQLQWVTQAQFAGYYVALDKGFHEAIAQYLIAEKKAVTEDIEIMTKFGPFRKTTADIAE